MHWNSLFFRWKIKTFSGEGPPQNSPLPRPLLQWGGGHPLPTPTPSAPSAPRSSRLRREELGACGASSLAPPFGNPGSATGCRSWQQVLGKWSQQWVFIGIRDPELKSTVLWVVLAVSKISNQFSVHSVWHSDWPLQQKNVPSCPVPRAGSASVVAGCWSTHCSHWLWLTDLHV